MISDQGTSMISTHVPTRDRCEKLRALGMSQETEFYWWQARTDLWMIIRLGREGKDDIAAPLATEMMEWLPESITQDKRYLRLMIWCYKTLYVVNYVKDGRFLIPDSIRRPSLPNALADLLIWCVEQGHVTWRGKG